MAAIARSSYSELFLLVKIVLSTFHGTMKLLYRLFILTPLLLSGIAKPTLAQSFIDDFGDHLNAIVESYDRSGCDIGVKVGEVPGYGSLCFENQGTSNLSDDVVITTVYSGARRIGFMTAQPYQDGFVYSATEMSTATTPTRTGGFIFRGQEIVGFFGDEAVALQHIQDIDTFKESLDMVFSTMP